MLEAVLQHLPLYFSAFRITEPFTEFDLLLDPIPRCGSPRRPDFMPSLLLFPSMLNHGLLDELLKVKNTFLIKRIKVTRDVNVRVQIFLGGIAQALVFMLDLLEELVNLFELLICRILVAEDLVLHLCCGCGSWNDSHEVEILGPGVHFLSV